MAIKSHFCPDYQEDGLGTIQAVRRDLERALRGVQEYERDYLAAITNRRNRRL